MHIFYVDESYDQTTFCLSALCIDVADWRKAFEATKEFRRGLKSKYGIRMRAELHAYSFVRYVNDGISRIVLSQPTRRQIFGEVLTHLASLPLTIFNAALPVANWGDTNRAHEIAIEKVANRVQVMADKSGSHALAIFDKNKEAEVTRIIRRLTAFNPIPSAYERWPDGSTHRNIVLDRFIDDVVFKDSSRSYFLQLADFAAWSLLKKEVQPTGFVRSFRYNEAFAVLEPRCHTAATRYDPLGIIRK